MGALKELDAHLVITVPLYLCFEPAGAGLIGLYGGEVVVLPMIKVRQRAARSARHAGEQALRLARSGLPRTFPGNRARFSSWRHSRGRPANTQRRKTGYERRSRRPQRAPVISS